MKLLQDEDHDYGYVVERGQKYIGIVSVESLKQALSQGQSLDSALLSAPEAVDADTSLNELISLVAQSPCGVPVTSADGIFIGIINKGTLLQALDKEGPNQ